MEDAENRAERLSREVERLRGRITELEALNAALRAKEKALREAETRLHTVTASTDYAIVSLNSKNRITFWNQGAANMFGYTREDVLDKPMTTVIPELNSERLLGIRNDGASKEPKLSSTKLELTGLRKNGDEFPLEACLSYVQSGAALIFTTIIRDISYRKTALRTLEVKTAEARQKTEDLECLIQTVAHDLKSPVITIGGLARRLTNSTNMLPSDPERDRVLHQIRCSAQSIELFLKDLLEALSVTHTGHEWVSVHMEAAVQQVVRQHEQEIVDQGITVDVETETAVPPVAGDKHRLIQVLDNLLVNALRHMGRRENPRVRIQCATRKGFVLISVSDNGIGIPRKYHQKIFERFFRSPDAENSGSGTGLGLFIAKKIVESHKGRIWVESEEGQGATFRFTLPRYVSHEGVDYEI